VEAALYMAANTMRTTYYQATGNKKGGTEKRTKRVELKNESNANQVYKNDTCIIN
jgi:hypothetical protein